MRDVIWLGDGRDPTAYTDLPKDEWPESIVVYHSGHSHDEVPVVYVKSSVASQTGGEVERMKLRIRELVLEKEALAHEASDMRFGLSLLGVGNG